MFGRNFIAIPSCYAYMCIVYDLIVYELAHITPKKPNSPKRFCIFNHSYNYLVAQPYNRSNHMTTVNKDVR